MVKLNQQGAVSGAAVSLGLTVTLLIVAIIFGIWAFSSRQDYKNNADAKIVTAVAAAQKQQISVDTQQAAEAAKQPLTTYKGPEAYGSVVLQYPKTWSGYVDDTGNGSAPVDGYFAPGVVPSTSNQASIFALRLQVLNQAYSQVLQGLQSQAQSGSSGVTINAYALPSLPKVVGVEVTGNLSGANSSSTTMVVLPLRSYTIEISTQGSQYLSDFNNNILKNFSFSP